MAKIRVLVVDDSAFMRNMLARMIERDPRFEVIDKAENGQQAIEKVAALKPDVVTLDIEMPVMNGLDALRRIMAKTPVPVVMVSSLTEAGARETMQALESGAVDFIPKSLQDRDKNIFHVGEVLHEKLVAAASARMDRVARPPVTPASLAERATTLAQQPAAVAPRLTPQSMASMPSKKLPSVRLLLIGSSTGGPRALQDIVPLLPGQLRVPVVIAQHMPPNFTNAMAIRLNEQSHIAVEEGKNGTVLQPGHVYVAPGGLHMRIKNEGGRMVLHTAEDKGESLYRPSVDVLAESAFEAVGKEVLAVMLTGMGNDGAKAFAKLHQNGAHTIAQEESSCVVYGMPKAVVDAGAASEVLPLRDIVGRVTNLLS